jgi:hypothetical protein
VAVGIGVGLHGDAFAGNALDRVSAFEHWPDLFDDHTLSGDGLIGLGNGRAGFLFSGHGCAVGD